MSEPLQPIIVIKKKVGHGGHHGGAWKVAYADFVTAMMSLFIVLWLMSSSDNVKKSVSGYFNDPKGTSKEVGSSQSGTGDAVPLKKEDLSKLKEVLLQSAQKLADFERLKKQIEITVTQEGLRIELMEDPHGTFFELGSSQPTPALRELLTALSQELGKMPNKISVEGHTDATPYSSSKTYSNWELSADRANIARRLMQESGVGESQVAQVRGFADQKLRKPLQPQDPSNRRITLIVQSVDAPPAPEEKSSPNQPAEAKGSGEGTKEEASKGE